MWMCANDTCGCRVCTACYDRQHVLRSYVQVSTKVYASASVSSPRGCESFRRVGVKTRAIAVPMFSRALEFQAERRRRKRTRGSYCKRMLLHIRMSKMQRSTLRAQTGTN